MSTQSHSLGLAEQLTIEQAQTLIDDPAAIAAYEFHIRFPSKTYRETYLLAIDWLYAWCFVNFPEVSQ